jgi:hypothetical protein
VGWGRGAAGVSSCEQQTAGLRGNALPPGQCAAPRPHAGPSSSRPPAQAAARPHSTAAEAQPPTRRRGRPLALCAAAGLLQQRAPPGHVLQPPPAPRARQQRLQPLQRAQRGADSRRGRRGRVRERLLARQLHGARDGGPEEGRRRDGEGVQSSSARVAPAAVPAAAGRLRSAERARALQQRPLAPSAPLSAPGKPLWQALKHPGPGPAPGPAPAAPAPPAPAAHLSRAVTRRACSCCCSSAACAGEPVRPTTAGRCAGGSASKKSAMRMA